MSSIEIRKIGITKLDTDVVVNAANTGLLEGGGVCGYIFHDAGSKEMTAACQKIGHCDEGSAVITPGFKLPAKYVIHAVGPRWSGGEYNEPKLLYSAYKQSLLLAKENGLHSIGFPLISAGIFGYPVDKAWREAIQACNGFIQNNPDYDIKIIFAVLDDKILAAGEETLKEIVGDEKIEDKVYFKNAYFIIGTAYAGKSTMVKELAKRHGGIACEENYHDNYPEELDSDEFPCLTYTRDLEDWHDFIRRSPQEYKAWIDGVKKECEILELRMLPEICNQGKPVFVDTNISIATLKRIAPENHTLVMLADPMISVRRFFERPDPEKQFLYRLILEEPDPEYAMQNYRKGLELINSKETYDEFLNSGFTTILRDENRTIDETVALAEKAFGL